MIPAHAGETAELGQDGTLDLFGQDEIGKLQRCIAVLAIAQDHATREATAKCQILELHNAGRFRQDALGNRLEDLVGPDRRHGDHALGEQLDRLGIAGGIGTVVVERRGDVLQDFPGLAERFIAESFGVVVDREDLRVEAVGQQRR